jgi:hypothetical protein
MGAAFAKILVVRFSSSRRVKIEERSPSGRFAFEQEGRKGEEDRKGCDGVEAVVRDIEATRSVGRNGNPRQSPHLPAFLSLPAFVLNHTV